MDLETLYKQKQVFEREFGRGNGATGGGAEIKAAGSGDDGGRLSARLSRAPSNVESRLGRAPSNVEMRAIEGGRAGGGGLSMGGGNNKYSADDDL